MVTALFYLALLTCTLLLVGVYGCVITTNEYLALEEFYNSNNGTQWLMSSNTSVWSFPSSLSAPCTDNWEGITCAHHTNANCYVAQLSLFHFNIAGNRLFLCRVLLYHKHVGSLPESLCSLSYLQVLDLSDNQLSYSIPSCIGQLYGLNSLDLSQNRMISSIPFSFGMLTNLTSLYLQNNQFSGQIPLNIGSASSLVVLDLSWNLFTSSLPSSIGAMKNLETLSLSINSLSGIIPSSIANCTCLQSIDFSYNYLSGELPPGLSTLVELASLSLQNNNFEGPILFVSGLKSLTALNMSVNSLHGFFPVVVDLVSLSTLDVSFNRIIGTLDDSGIGSLMALNNIYLNDNIISGSIPVFDSEMLLYTMDLSHNLLDGSVPTGLLSITALSTLTLADNYLSGSLPNSLITLNYLDVSNNALTGTLPGDLSDQFSGLNLSCNSLVGRVPAYFHNLVYMDTLDLHSNFLTSIDEMDWSLMSLFVLDLSQNLLAGTVSSSLGGDGIYDYMNTTIMISSMLIEVNLASNFLSGSLPSQFGLSQSIVELNLGFNSFTGTIPSFLFATTSLMLLNIENNCLSGTIPLEICDASSIEYLLMDAMSNQCSKNSFSTLSSSAGSFLQGKHDLFTMKSTVPDCLWSSKKLKMLHLAGNGLTGTIGDIAVDGSLTILVVPNNKFHGTISESIQEHNQFTQLILSNNMLSGTLSANFTVNGNMTFLNLTMNRLSNKIPNQFSNAVNLNVLTGNLWSCDGIPTKDANYLQYTCESENFNIAIILYVVMLAMSGLCAVCIVGFYGRTWTMSFASTLSGYWQEILSGHTSSRLSTFVDMLFMLITSAIKVAILQLIGGLILYLTVKSTTALSARYSTYRTQYGWITTAAFLHDWLPAFSIAFINAGALMIVVQSWQHTENYPLTSSLQTIRVGVNNNEKITASVVSKMPWVIPMAIQVANAFVALLANGAYVVAAYANLSLVQITVVQMMLGAFKVCWSAAVSEFVLQNHRRSQDKLSLISPTMQLFCIQLCNFVFAPLTATLLTDGNCFFYEIVGNPEVLDSVPAIAFLIPNQVTTMGSSVSTSTTPLSSAMVTPAWLYYYQCSSALVVNYVPVLMFAYLTCGIIWPVAMISAILWPMPISRLKYMVPQVVIDALVTDTLLFAVAFYDDSNLIDSVESALSVSPVVSATTCQLPAGSHTTNTSAAAPAQIVSDAGNVQGELFSWSMIVSSSLVHLAVLLTFGLASPLLGLMVALAIASQIALVVLMLGCYLSKSKAKDKAKDNASAMATLECCLSAQLANDVRGCWAAVLCVATVYWLGFYADMLFDVPLFTMTVPCLIIFGVLMPCCAVASMVLWKYCKSLENANNDDSSKLVKNMIRSDLELTETSS